MYDTWIVNLLIENFNINYKNSKKINFYRILNFLQNIKLKN